MSFFDELKRRNVFRVGIAYAITAWLLIQVADILLETFKAPDWTMQFIVVVLLIGFPLALFFAWAFELTPEGVKREKDIDRGESIAPHTGKKLDRVIILGLVVVIVLMGIERFWFAGPETGEPSVAPTAKAIESSKSGLAKLEPAAAAVPDTEPGTRHQESVAVLPFTAMSSGEDDEYFADGLTEEILNSLAGLPELLVTARTSSFHFKGQDLPIPEIAKTLGVNHVVEGSVRRAGERVRITAQLIRAEDGFHLWSDTYDRTLEDIFAVQEDIAQNIAQTLDVVLDEGKRQAMREAGIGNVEAFILFQKAMEAFGQAHSTSDPGAKLPEANRLFDQALAIVPDIPDALYLKTDLYGHLIYAHASNIAPASQPALEAAMGEIRANLSAAIRTTNSPHRRAVLEVERIQFSDDWTGLQEKLARAFVPGDCAPFNWMPSVAAPYGWARQVARHSRDVMRCDPLSGLGAAMLVFWELWSEEPELALQAANRYLDEVGPHPWVEDLRFVALLATGQFPGHPEVFGPNPEGSIFLFPRKIFAYAMQRDMDTARQVLEEWQAKQPTDDLSMVAVSAVLGDRARANEFAARIDARYGGTFMLAETVKGCLCGAPFDLDATPNFKARIEEAGFSWPPVNPIKYPAKDW